MHQGCCFVKYANLASAQTAIQALHNQRSLPPLRNPLQVRFADSGGNAADRGQTNAENKLFVGGVPVGCGDKELRSLFSNYGEVQDVYILASKSSQEGQRGCAFVRYAAPQVRSASSI
jgi:CUG-BP- and ETR3-like factor